METVNEQKDYTDITAALNNYFRAVLELRRLQISPNSKDFTSQLGEWLVSELFDGKRAASGIQKDWDLLVGDYKYQVKTHAKARSTTASWSAVEYGDNPQIDYLIIIVFNQEYKLKEFFRIPWKECCGIISLNKSGKVLYWNRLRNYKIALNELPKQQLISVFL